ncbi:MULTISPECIES: protein kinase family protein [Terrisporobacter]|uniref:protein kinase family protein n=1 Tax=Terrisporobacter TaxID=1505652 RepID=UPI00265AFAA8|nr:MULTISPECIES: protein kinase family protein [Terrisporobacter]MCC3668612.1 protein kinase family protein [Terrisporobacter mayombei]MDU6984288.1 protein kinase family protein [Terrisporobacter othiniensis]
MKYFNETYIKRKFMTRNEWADTYKAVHATTEEKVILKVLVRKSQDEEYINNLLKEVDNLKTIRNPNLIHVNNMFKYSGCGKTYYYIEGEYFKGISLEEKLASKKFEENEALKIVETVSQGLKEFHDRNMLFNNLSLNNIFINSKDIVKADILSYLENKEFAYLSQEDEETKVEELKFNPEKDIYDLGVVLYSLLTGKLTFEANNYKKQISNKNLVSIIEKATNNNLESKYRNIDRFILDLKSYLQYGELSNETYDVEEILPRKKRKKGKLGKTLGVCAAIVIVGGAAVYGYDLLEKNKKDVEANTTKIEETTKPKEEDNKVEENKEEKTDKNKTATSNKKDNQSSKKDSSTSDLNKSNSSNNNSNNNNSSSNSSNNNNSNSSSSSNNNSNNNSSNNTSKPNKPNKPNNTGGSGGTITNPDEGNNGVNQTPEVTPPSNDNSGSENTTPEAPSPEVESE